MRWLLACLALSACYSPTPDYANGQLACPDEDCPSGMHCASNDTCWRDGEDHTVSVVVADLEGTGLVLANNGGDDLTVDANGTYTFVAPIAVGGTYAVTVKTQPRLPAQTCTVTGGAGTAAGDVTGVSVTCELPVSRFLYAIDVFGGVTAYAFDESLDMVRAHSRTVLAQDGGQSLAVDDAGRFLYAGTTTSPRVIAQAIGSDGFLAPLAAGVAVAGLPYGLAVDPTGRFAYAIDGGPTGGISGYGVAADGNLTPLTPALVTAAGSPSAIRVDPSGRFAYAIHLTAAQVEAYTIDATTGALTLVGGVATQAEPVDLQIDPRGRFVYVVNLMSDSVSAYAISPLTGALTLVEHHPLPAGSQPRSIAIDPVGRRAAVLRPGQNQVSVLTIVAGGGLEDAGASAAVDPDAQHVAIDASGTRLFVAGAATLRWYTLGAGAPSPLGVVPTSGPTRALAVTRGATPVRYAPRFLYLNSIAGDSVSAYTISPTGTLTSVGPPVPSGDAIDAEAVFVVAHPNGKFLYSVNRAEKTVTVYRIDAQTGALTKVGSSVNVSSFARGMAIFGNSAYVSRGEGDGSIMRYDIEPTTGVISTNVGGTPAGLGVTPLAIDPVGRFLYAGNTTANTISCYTIHPRTGVLSALANNATIASEGNEPRAIVIDPSGRFLYAITVQGIAQFIITQSSGELVKVAPDNLIDAGNTPSWGAIEPTGRFLYVTNRVSNTLSVFTIDPGNGALTPHATPTVATGLSPSSVAVDPSGQFLYVNNAGGGISVFAIAGDGGLSTVGEAVIPQGTTDGLTVVGGIQ